MGLYKADQKASTFKALPRAQKEYNLIIKWTVGVHCIVGHGKSAGIINREYGLWEYQT